MAEDRFPCIVGGERSGKSTVLAKLFVAHMLALPYVRSEKFLKPDGSIAFDVKKDRPRDPHFALFGPTYKEPRTEFGYIEQDLKQLGKLADGHSSKPSDGPWRLVTTDGVVLTTISLEIPEGVRSIDLEMAGVCEAGGCPYAGIERVRGRVAAKRGPIIFSGTIERAQQWWKDWLLEGRRPNLKGITSYMIPSWGNLHEFPGGRQDPEIIAWCDFLGEDLFNERCAAIPMPPRTRVVKEAREEHIQRIQYPDDAELYIAVDPGYATAYAILFCAVWMEGDKQRFHFFHEFYEQNKTTDLLVDACKRLAWWPRVRYGAIDTSAKAHRDSNQSALEIWKKLTPVEWYHKYWARDRQRERIQTTFRHDQITIDPSCKGFIAELGLGEPVFPEMHEWRYPTDRDGRVISDEPEDKWNHASAACAYLLLKIQGQVESFHKMRSRNRLKEAGRAVDTHAYSA